MIIRKINNNKFDNNKVKMKLEQIVAIVWKYGEVQVINLAVTNIEISIYKSSII